NDPELTVPSPRWRGVCFQQGSIQKSSQSDGFNRLLYKLITVCASFIERVRISIAADEKRRKRHSIFSAKPLDGINASFSITEAVVGNNEIGCLRVIGQAGHRVLYRGPRNDAATPASKKSTHSL